MAAHRIPKLDLSACSSSCLQGQLTARSLPHSDCHQENQIRLDTALQVEKQLHEKIAELITCTVCLDVGTQVWQCVNAHCVCEACMVGIHDVCPVCQAEPPEYRRNFTLEQIAAQLTVPCNWRDEGCMQVCTLSGRAEHEMNCKLRPMSCPLTGIGHNSVALNPSYCCDYTTNSFDEWNEHLKDFHGIASTRFELWNKWFTVRERHEKEADKEEHSDAAAANRGNGDTGEVNEDIAPDEPNMLFTGNIFRDCSFDCGDKAVIATCHADADDLVFHIYAWRPPGAPHPAASIIQLQMRPQASSLSNIMLNLPVETMRPHVSIALSDGSSWTDTRFGCRS